MEQRIVINGKVWVVPADRINGLLSWLEGNAVDTTRAQPIREITSERQDPRELLLEKR